MGSVYLKLRPQEVLPVKCGPTGISNRAVGRMVGYPEAIADLYPMTSHVVYAASRISSNLKGSTKQFGWLQAPATNLIIGLEAELLFPARAKRH